MVNRVDNGLKDAFYVARVMNMQFTVLFGYSVNFNPRAFHRVNLMHFPFLFLSENEQVHRSPFVVVFLFAKLTIRGAGVKVVVAKKLEIITMAKRRVLCALFTINKERCSMKPIPKIVDPILLPGLKLVARGKVCELYELPHHPDLLLKVVSDRASVHDIILPFHVPRKGEVLNFVDHFWRTTFSWIASDLVAIGPEINAYLPEPLRGNTNLLYRARVIQKCDALPAEIIYRWLLTGTGLKKYRQDNGMICGQQFPSGLKEWDELKPSAFTPTTKSPDGHDEHMTVLEFRERFGPVPEDVTRTVFEQGKKFAVEKGIAVADTKFEVGLKENRLILIDEILTPDSSRFLRMEDVMRARGSGEKPPSYDKQPIRDYVEKTLGVGPSTPLTDDVIRKVQGHSYPDELIAETSFRYTNLLKLFTGMTPTAYLGGFFVAGKE